MASGQIAQTIYTLKSSPYSSHSLLLEVLPVEGHGRRVLDLGCGNGYLADLIARRGYRAVGVERRGGVTGPFPENVELITADLEQGIPRIEGRFAFIVCADILEHLRDPLSVLAGIPDLLEPGGVLIGSLPNSGNIYFRLQILFGRFPQHDKGLFDRTHLHFYTLDGWSDLFRRAGFEITRLQPTGIPVGLALPRFEGSFLVRACERICYDLSRLRKTLFAYQFITVARPVQRAG